MSAKLKIYAFEQRFGWKFVRAKSFEDAIKKYNEDVLNRIDRTTQVRVLLDENLEMNFDTFAEIVRVETLRRRPVITVTHRRFRRRRHPHRRH